jgi:hypothetical protein
MIENTSLSKRVKLHKYIVSESQKDGDILCPDEFNVLNHDVLLLEQIGSKSINGEAFKACKPYDEILHGCTDDPGTVLLSTKKIPLTQYQRIMFPSHTSKEELLENDVFVELMCMRLSNYILLNEKPICPNLPLYYNYYLCNNCTYTNEEILNKNKYLITKAEKLTVINEGQEFSGKLLLLNIQSNLKKRNKVILDANDTDQLSEKVGPYIAKVFKKAINDNITNSCVLLINEYANEGDLKNWLKIKNWSQDESRTDEEWHVMFFQVFAGLYALQKHFDLTHHDLHWGNVLVHKIQPGGFLTYKIDDEYYKIPNIGYLFTLWDFGYAHIPGKLQASNDPDIYNLKGKNRYSVDYFRISHATWWNMETKKNIFPNGITPPEIVEFYYNIKYCYDNNMPLKYIFSKLFSSYINLDTTIDATYKIDDNNVPIVPDEYKWILNNNKNYEYFDWDKYVLSKLEQ